MVDYASAGSVFGGSIDNSEITAGSIDTDRLKAQTQGDILYFGAAGAASLLNAGTSGQFLKTQGAGNNPLWANAGDMVLLGSDTLGAGAATMGVSGLTTTDYKGIKVYGMVKTATTDGLSIHMRINADTGANYGWRYYDSGGSGSSAADDEARVVNYAGNSYFTPFEFVCSNIQALTKVFTGTWGNVTRVGTNAGIWTNTADKITSLSFRTESGSENLAAGSFVVVYGLR